MFEFSADKMERGKDGGYGEEEEIGRPWPDLQKRRAKTFSGHFFTQGQTVEKRRNCKIFMRLGIAPFPI